MTDHYDETDPEANVLQEDDGAPKSFFDPTGVDDVIKAAQKEFRDKAALLQASIRDLQKHGMQIHDIQILAQRIEYIVNMLWPAFLREEDAATNDIPTNPDRLKVETGWVQVLTDMHKQAQRQALVAGAGMGEGLIVPTPKVPGL